MRRWVQGVGIVSLTAALLGCTGGDPAASKKPRSRATADAVAAMKVVESIKPGDSTGFDPEAWSSATNQAGVMPPGGTLRVVKGVDLRDTVIPLVGINTAFASRDAARHDSYTGGSVHGVARTGNVVVRFVPLPRIPRMVDPADAKAEADARKVFTDSAVAALIDASVQRIRHG